MSRWDGIQNASGGFHSHHRAGVLYGGDWDDRGERGGGGVPIFAGTSDKKSVALVYCYGIEDLVSGFEYLGVIGVSV